VAHLGSQVVRFHVGRNVRPTTRVPCSHDQLVVACGLYFTLPFGQMHARNPQIVEAARLLGRTPSSLAMKLVNFASLDPEQRARGIRGLAGHSRADEQVWSEFDASWDEMALVSEAKLRGLQAAHPSQSAALDATDLGDRPTETENVIKVRTMQGFFRKLVLGAYNSKCCVTGNPVGGLLVASHILPWGGFPKERLNPRNGLCLAAHFDKAFDCGLIAFDERLRLMLSPVLRRHLTSDAIRSEFGERDGQPLLLRHSREITLLCSPKVTHHHDQLGGVLPPGKNVILPPGKSVILPPGKCSVRACPVHPRSRIACAGGQFLLRPQHVTRPWRG